MRREAPPALPRAAAHRREPGRRARSPPRDRSRRPRHRSRACRARAHDRRRRRCAARRRPGASASARAVAAAASTGPIPQTSPSRPSSSRSVAATRRTSGTRRSYARRRGPALAEGSQPPHRSPTATACFIDAMNTVIVDPDVVVAAPSPARPPVLDGEHLPPRRPPAQRPPVPHPHRDDADARTDGSCPTSDSCRAATQTLRQRREPEDRMPRRLGLPSSPSTRARRRRTGASPGRARSSAAAPGPRRRDRSPRRGSAAVAAAAQLDRGRGRAFRTQFRSPDGATSQRSSPSVTIETGVDHGRPLTRPGTVSTYVRGPVRPSRASGRTRPLRPRRQRLWRYSSSTRHRRARRRRRPNGDAVDDRVAVRERPSSSSSASGFSTSRWIARFSGRAPNAGSQPASAISATPRRTAPARSSAPPGGRADARAGARRSTRSGRA